MSARNSKTSNVFATQGTLDGLCGPYSFANSLVCCGFEQEVAIKAFGVLCEWLVGKWGASCLLEGTSEKQMFPGIKHCQAVIGELNRDLLIQYPWRSIASRPKNGAQFIEKFDSFNSELVARWCAIVQTRDNPNFSHWTVIRSVGPNIEFIDSSPDYRTPSQKRKSTLFSENQRIWSPDFKHLILIAKKEDK